MKVVALPDGTRIGFPDNMSPDQIKVALDKKFARPQEPKEWTAEDEMKRRRMELFGRDRSLGEIASDPQLEPAQRMDAARQIASRMDRDPMDVFFGKLPFVGPAFNMMRKGDSDFWNERMSDLGGRSLRQSLENIQAGRGDFHDFMNLAGEERNRQLQGEQGRVGRVAEGTLQALGIMAEYLATGGAAGYARAGMAGRLAPAAAEVARVPEALLGASSLLSRTAGTAAGIATQAAMLPLRSQEIYYENRKKGQGPVKAFNMAFLENARNIAIEQSGVSIPKSKMAERAVAWLSAKAGKKISGLTAKTVGGMQFHGPLNEYIEERFQELTQPYFDGELPGVSGAVLEGEYQKALSQTIDELAQFVAIGSITRAPQAASAAFNAMAEIDEQQVGMNRLKRDVREMNKGTAWSIDKDGAVQQPREKYPPTTNRQRERAEDTFEEVYGDGQIRKQFYTEGQKQARSFFQENPTRIEQVAALPDTPSRTEFAKASGLPRASSSSQVRSDYVQMARELNETGEFAEPPPEAPASKPDLVAMSLKSSQQQMESVLSVPAAEAEFRSQLGEMSAKEIAETYGYKTTKKNKHGKEVPAVPRKQKMIDEIVDRFTPTKEPYVRPKIQEVDVYGPTRKDRQRKPYQSPQIDTQEILGPTRRSQQTPEPSPLRPPPQVARQQQPVQQPEPVAQPKKTEAPPQQVVDVYNQLPSDKKELESLAAVMGVELPKKGTKARQALDADTIRWDIANAMANPAGRKGLAGEVPGGQRTTPKKPYKKPVIETAEVLGPTRRDKQEKKKGVYVSPSVTTGEFQQPTRRQFQPQPGKNKGVKTKARNISDQEVRRIWSNITTKLGKKLRRVPTPKKQVHREIEQLAATMNVRVVWYKSEEEIGSLLHGFAQEGLAFLQVDRTEDALWGTAGHEIAHATGIDKLRDQFSEKLIAQYSNKVLNKVPPASAARIKATEGLLEREAVAEIIQDYMTNARFRSRLKRENPGLVMTIVDRVVDVWTKVNFPKDAAKKIESLLRREMNHHVYSEAKARLVARDIADAYVESGQVPEDQRFQAEEDIYTEIGKVYDELLERHNEREAAKAYLKSLHQENARTIASKENKGKDHSKLTSSDTIAREAARQYPGAFGYPDLDAPRDELDHLAPMAWELMREEKTEPPKMYDKEVVDLAVSRAMGNVDVDEAANVVKATKEQLMSGTDAELFQDIMDQVRQEWEDAGFPVDQETIENQAMARLAEMAEADVDDIPFEEEKTDDGFADARLQKIAEIPGAYELAKKLAKNPKLIPSLEQVETYRAFNMANYGRSIAARQQIGVARWNAGQTAYRSRSAVEKAASKMLDRMTPKRFIDSIVRRFEAEGENFSYSGVVEAMAASLVEGSYGATIALDPMSADGDKFAKFTEAIMRARSNAGWMLGLRDPVYQSRHSVRASALNRVVYQSDPKARKQILKALKDNGIEFTKDLYKDKDKVIRALALARNNANTNVSDMIYEFYLNMVLSGPQTQMANIIGNAANMALYNGLERPMDIFLGKVHKSFRDEAEYREFRELKYVYKAMAAALPEALANSVKAWKHEYSPLNESVEAGNVEMAANQLSQDVKTGAIPGKIGRKVRAFGYRQLSFMDEFFRTAAANSAAAGWAFRFGRMQGLDGDMLSDYIAQQMADRTSVAWARAMAEANTQSFQGKVGPIGEGFKELARTGKRRIPVVRYVVPFSNFAVNAFSRGIPFVPGVGIGATVFNWAHAKDKGIQFDPEVQRLIGRQLLGFAGYALVKSLMDNGDDEDGMPILTGTREQKIATRAGQFRTAPPLSIRLFGKYVSYSRIEPINFILSAIVDYVEDQKKGLFPGVNAWKTIVSQFADKNYLQGVSDLVSVAEKERGLWDVGANIAVGFVPNLWKQPKRELRNAITDTRVRWDDPLSSKLQKLAVKAEIPFVGYIYRRDVWGRKLQPNWPSSSWPAALYRVAVPFKIRSKKDVNKADLALMKYIEAHPEEEVSWWTVPRIDQVERSIKGPVTDQEYEMYLRERGTVAKNIADRIPWKDNPTAAQIKAMRNGFTRATGVAKKRLLARRRGVSLPKLPGWDDGE